MAGRYLRVLTRLGFYYLCGIVAGLLLIFFVGNQVNVSKFQQVQEATGPEEVMTTTHKPRRFFPTTKNPNFVSPDPVPSEDMRWLKEYQRNEEKWCKQKPANLSKTNWCPCIPPGLQGRVIVNKADDSTWSNITESVGADVRSGGEWMPEDCVARTRLAIIIPCRDRESHLRVLLRHIFPILKRQLVHFRIFVADQRLPMIFNKAAIMNIGFLEAQKRFPFDCVMFHDVDMLLEDDRALMTCGPNPRHYARALDKFGYTLYPTFGGVVSLTADMFRKVNGYSLKYFGWGGEDDDMWSRVGQLWNIYGMPPVVSRYSTIFHFMDGTNKRNPKRHKLMDIGFENNKNKAFDGLSDLVYDVNSVDIKPLYTRIEADINITVLNYPHYRTFKYRRVAGYCLDSDVIIASNGVSWSSCRFQCDTFEEQSCFGFSHVTGKCTLIRAICNLSPVPGWTYVKEDEFNSL